MCARFNCKWEAGPEKKTQEVAEKEGEAKKQDTKKKKSKLEKALNEKLSKFLLTSATFFVANFHKPSLKSLIFIS